MNRLSLLFARHRNGAGRRGGYVRSSVTAIPENDNVEFSSPPRHARRRRGRRLGQRGQVMVLTSLMAPILIGITAVSIDSSNIAAQRRLLQSAGDTSALAAGTQMLNGQTQTAATAAAKQIMTLDGFPASEITVTYFDSAHAATAVDANTQYVDTSISHSVRNWFGGVMGIGTETLTLSAEAHIGAWSGKTSGAWCAICALNTSMTKAIWFASTSVTVNAGGFEVMSNAPGAFTNAASVTMTGSPKEIKIAGPAVGSIVGTVGGSPTITYNYTTSSPDPFSYLPAYSAGAAGPGADISGVASPAPGTYHNMTVTGTTTLTAGGVYVITGLLKVNAGAKLISNGSLLYFACTAYPTACLSAGESGGNFWDASSNGTNLTPIVGGAWNGMAVFFDRANTATWRWDDGGGGGSGTNVKGGIYMKKGFADLSTSASLSWNVRIVADHAYWNTSGNTASFDASGIVGGALSVYLTT